MKRAAGLKGRGLRGRAARLFLVAEGLEPHEPVHDQFAGGDTHLGGRQWKLHRKE